MALRLRTISANDNVFRSEMRSRSRYHFARFARRLAVEYVWSLLTNLRVALRLTPAKRLTKVSSGAGVSSTARINSNGSAQRIL
jgi:hypothetical protein